MSFSALILGLIVVLFLFLLWKKNSHKKTPAHDAPSRAQEKGQRGEQLVIEQYQQHFGDEYLLLNNCTFIDQANGSTQVDHILISPYGIFVIETKHYAGLIFGSKDSKVWTQCLPNSKQTFQNPIFQNKKHISVLGDLLKGHIAPYALHSVIVFNGKSQFKYEMPAHVVSGGQWIHYVKTFRTQIMTLDEVAAIYAHLQKSALPQNQATEQLHIENLKRKYAEQHQQKSP